MRGSADPTVPLENDKATVVALREIAAGHTDFSDAHEIDMMPSSSTESHETNETPDTTDVNTIMPTAENHSAESE